MDHKKTLITILCVSVLLAGVTAQAGETLDTRIGKLSFTHDFANGYPTTETVDKLFDEMDFQRATQVYLWSLPLVAFANWQHVHMEQLGAVNGQIVFLKATKTN